MRRHPMTRFAPLVCAVLLLPALAAAAADWPQFRGPDRDGISRETGLKAAWPEGGPEVLWRTELGEGYSAVSLAGGRLFTMFARGGDEFVVSLDPADGKQLWRVRIDDTWKDRQGNGPRATPTVDDGRVYAVSGGGKLVALAAADGKMLWSYDLEAEFDAKIPRWGMASSPLVEDGKLLVEVGGKPGALIVAFDKVTGKELWRSQEGKAGYSAPLALTAGGARQVLFFSGDTLHSISPEDGKLLWKLPWKTSYDVNAATPIFIPPDRVFISSGYDVGGTLLKLGASGGKVAVEQVWKSREMKNQFSSSIHRNGYLYGFDDKMLKCLDVATGETKWQERGFSHGSLIYADGHLIVLGEKGLLALVEATPEGYREKGRVQIFSGKTWTMPVLVDGRLYVRDEKELVALGVAG